MKKSQSILYFMQGLSHEEISELLEVTKERARKIRCLALKELAQQFKGMKLKISDEKILDYIDGILSKEEENDVKNAIEQDENIKNTFLELKQKSYRRSCLFA